MPRWLQGDSDQDGGDALRRNVPTTDCLAAAHNATSSHMALRWTSCRWAGHQKHSWFPVTYPLRGTLVGTLSRSGSAGVRSFSGRDLCRQGVAPAWRERVAFRSQWRRAASSNGTYHGRLSRGQVASFTTVCRLCCGIKVYR